VFVVAMPVPELLDEIEAGLRGYVADLDPDRVPAVAAERVFAQLAAIERLASSALILLARRVEAAGGHRQAGCRNAAEQIAKGLGRSVSGAKRMLETSHQLEALPTVADAARAGVLAGPAIEAVAGAAAVAPDYEEKLVAVAARSTYADTRDACLRARASRGRDENHKRIRAERYLREWTDAEGAWNFKGRGTVDEAARFRAAIAPVVDEFFKQARTTDVKEPREAYAFDALMHLVTAERTERTTAAPRFMGLLRLDYNALVRGSVEDDEVCEIAGLGPIPVSTARELLGDAILKLVITKGVDVVNVTHLGRSATVAQQVALWWRDPLCTREGCGRAYRLEIDHREDWAKTHHTRVDEADRLCAADHDLKTRHGWALVDGVGRRPMVPPDHPFHPNAAKATARSLSDTARARRDAGHLILDN
jgi:hypothetical protein